MIPRTIHRIWVGGTEPEWTSRLGATWAAHHPDWTVRQWTDASVGELFPLRNQAIYDAAHELFPRHVGQLRSDLLRYEILHRFGGLYIDADFEALRPLDTLIDGATAFAAWEEQDRWIANGLMGATPNHPFIDRLIRGVPGSIRRRPGQRPARVTGPQYLTRTYRAHGGLDRVLDQHLVYPYSYRDLGEIGGALPNQFAGAYTVHHWHNQRREHGIGVG